MKLSELNPNDVKPVGNDVPTSGLKLSQLHPDDITPVTKALSSDPSQSQQDPGLGQTVVDQGLQGLTMGFSDELAGLGSAGVQAATGDFGPKQGRSWEALKAAYIQMRDDQRKKLEQERKTHPVASVAANVVGSIPTMLIGGEALGAAGMTGEGAQAATMGAATGLGSSNSDSLQGMAADTAMGAGFGYGGYRVGQGLSKLISPEEMATSASYNASKAMGVKPTQELASGTSSTGAIGTKNIRGVGTTALDENVANMTGGIKGAYDNSLKAIQKNQQTLAKITPQLQSKLDSDLPAILQDVEPVKDKAMQFMSEFQIDNRNAPGITGLNEKLGQEYMPIIDKLNQNEGNLSELIDIKTNLQNKADELNAYDPKNAMPGENIAKQAEFVSGLASIVRQHIEDLGMAVDPNLGQQFAQTNRTLSNLYTTNNSLFKGLNKNAGGYGLGKAVDFLLNAPTKLTTGYAPAQAGQLALAKGQQVLSNVTKAIGVDTPAGQLIQKTIVPKSISSAISSPSTQEMNPFHSSPQYDPNLNSPWSPKSNDGLREQSDLLQQYREATNSSNQAPATEISANLYNATNDSLKQVASNLSSSPALKYVGDHLSKALDNNDQNEKNRAIFLILQNPQARKLVSPSEDK